jgi:hypothetical protein
MKLLFHCQINGSVMSLNFNIMFKMGNRLFNAFTAAARLIISNPLCGHKSGNFFLFFFGGYIVKASEREVFKVKLNCGSFQWWS